ncbi:MAG: phosphate ABC transporter substrate-binding protein [Nostocales cyanobacterium LacPavin_0920_SED1_MAG_38_18]|jgi:phosphate transport system substrate-binding protein|uniref:Phosphate ABC transporter substrate-binding protein n=1 Tax=Aphanizomenon flos-aquae FACHB-1040 TaxID=2692887 RepID=A0ABR8C1K1_APHFL|nr:MULTISPECIES: phosphate ABC transporter substrate-binding protein [Nostocales]ALB40859.1 porin [Anabaena sp. WA102]MBD2280993.1 phosphate ABC transporter substrate-binding protein [Aphanizomenon flos-aquae FACHB-1040]MCX5981311.1 phosphate ABC transporter substrate-binding protein [Nostocales cyanobacterium LacPavin_0920_SED1_MAG_38_18]
MSQRSGPPPIVFILLFSGLLGGGYWWFFMRNPAPNPTATQPESNSPAGETTTPTTPTSAAFPLPTTVASGTTVKIDGSTSMVTINQNLRKGFEKQFPGTKVEAVGNGTDKGIQDLLAGKVDIAAASRPLTAQEQGQKLKSVTITQDAIALIVGKANPFNRGLTSSQIADIFQGKINNWSAVGGLSATIRVINRPAISGTHQTFKELVLKGANFGTTPNITTLPQDATTPLVQALKTDGIGYATFAQVANQQTARVVAIEGLTPEAASYPYKRSLYYVYKDPASAGVQAFLGYATSPQGQQALTLGN